MCMCGGSGDPVNMLEENLCVKEYVERREKSD